MTAPVKMSDDAWERLKQNVAEAHRLVEERYAIADSQGIFSALSEAPPAAKEGGAESAPPPAAPPENQAADVDRA